MCIYVVQAFVVEPIKIVIYTQTCKYICITFSLYFSFFIKTKLNRELCKQMLAALAFHNICPIQCEKSDKKKNGFQSQFAALLHMLLSVSKVLLNNVKTGKRKYLLPFAVVIVVIVANTIGQLSRQPYQLSLGFGCFMKYSRNQNKSSQNVVANTNTKLCMAFKRYIEKSENL